jgi:hypothetical protein
LCFSRSLGIHLVPVVLGQGDGDLAWFVAGDACGNGLDLAGRQGRETTIPVDLQQRGGDLLAGHADVAHGSRQACQGGVTLAGRDRVGLGGAGRDVGERGRPGGQPVEQRDEPRRWLGEAFGQAVELQTLHPGVRAVGTPRRGYDDVAAFGARIDLGGQPAGGAAPVLPRRSGEDVVAAAARCEGGGRRGQVEVLIGVVVGPRVDRPTFKGVHIHDQHPGGGEGDVGVGVLGPPALDLPGVGGRVVISGEGSQPAWSMTGGKRERARKWTRSRRRGSVQAIRLFTVAAVPIRRTASSNPLRNTARMVSALPTPISSVSADDPVRAWPSECHPRHLCARAPSLTPFQSFLTREAVAPGRHTGIAA